MQTLLLLVAVCSAVAVADHQKVDDQQDIRTYPITTSEYLKVILGKTPGMVGLSNLVASQDVVSLLPALGLLEAAKIAEQVNLRKILVDSGLKSFTLFAPNDNAVLQWKKKVPELAADPDTLARLCQAWIVPAKVLSSDIQENEKVVQNMYGTKLRFNIYDVARKITVNGAPIVDVDKLATNGVVHVVDKVIFPLPDGTIFDTLSKLDQFSTIVDLVKKAELQDELITLDALTMFAPINEAFRYLPQGVLADLVADKAKLQTFVKYHVIMGTRYSAGLVEEQRMRAITGDLIKINMENRQILLNRENVDKPAQARVLYSDMPATNGVIHVIDRVLIPPQGYFILE